VGATTLIQDTIPPYHLVLLEEQYKTEKKGKKEKKLKSGSHAQSSRHL
jgi:hypothetical protein